LAAGISGALNSFTDRALAGRPIDFKSVLLGDVLIAGGGSALSAGLLGPLFEAGGQFSATGDPFTARRFFDLAFTQGLGGIGWRQLSSTQDTRPAGPADVDLSSRELLLAPNTK
jgi:hypothetical protein